MNNVMYLFIGPSYVAGDFCKHLILYLKICFIIYGVHLSGNGCVNPVYFSHQGEVVA